MKIKLLNYILISAVLFTMTIKNVQSCASCGGDVLGSFGSGTPILTMPATTLSKNKAAFGVNFNYQSVEEFSTFQISELRRRGAHAHTFDSQLSYSLFAAYGITDKISLIANYPFIMTLGLQTTDSGFLIDDGNSIGWGDLSLLVKYKFLELKKNKLQASVIAGIKMPTGDTSERNSLGFLLAADDQPGTGSWDPLMGFAVTKAFGSYSLDSNVLYRLSTKGAGDLITGDIINFNLALSKKIQKSDFLAKVFPGRLFGQNIDWNWSAEINGRWQEKTEFNSIKDTQHGGTTIFLTAGLKALINERLSFSTAFSYPVIEVLNGEQPDTNFLIFLSMAYLL